MLAVDTESGSTYLFSGGMKRVMRLPATSEEMRGDFMWYPVVNYQSIVVGEPMELLLDGIAAKGPTLRTTSNVTDMGVF